MTSKLEVQSYKKGEKPQAGRTALRERRMTGKPEARGGGGASVLPEPLQAGAPRWLELAGAPEVGLPRGSWAAVFCRLLLLRRPRKPWLGWFGLLGLSASHRRKQAAFKYQSVRLANRTECAWLNFIKWTCQGVDPKPDCPKWP